MIPRYINSSASLLVLSAVVFPSLATAETQKRTSMFLEEVIITATKREENLQDVGVSATAFNGEQLKNLNLSSMGEIAKFAPGIEFKRFWGAKGNASIFFIRGVGQADFNDGSESPSTVYSDDFYIMSSSATDFLMHDVASTELLRGPQGTLFGRNSTAGAVNVSNNLPVHEFEAELALTAGNYNQKEVDGVINVPIIEDKLAVRFAFNMDKFDPVTKNLFTGKGPGARDIHGGDFTSLRGLVLWEPTDELSINYKYQFGKVDGVTQGDNSLALEQVAGETILARNGEDAFGYNEAKFGASGASRVISDAKNGLINEIDIHVLNVDYSLSDNISITSITGYFEQYKQTFEECDGTPRTLCAIEQFVDQNYWTQEVRVSMDTDNARWTLGTFYLDQSFENNWDTVLASGTGTNGTDEPGGLIVISPNDMEKTSWSIYANVAYDVSDKLTLTAGLRYNEEENQFHQLDSVYNHNHPDTDTVTLGGDTFGIVSLEDEGFDNLKLNHLVGDPLRYIDFSDTYEDDFINYQIQIDYRVTDDLLVYSSFKSGVKSGGFNNGLTTYNEDRLDEVEFAKETNNAYEIGAKWTSDKYLLRVNGAVFYYDYEDYQATQFDAESTGIGVTVLNTDATVSGGEVEVFYSPAEGWDLSLAGGYIDSSIEDVTNVGLGVAETRDREFGHAPQWQGSAMVRYEAQIGDSGLLATQINYSYIAKRYVDVLNDPGTELPSHHVTNFNSTYRSSEGSSWYATAFVKNIENKRAISQQFNFSGLAGTGQVNYISPRTYGLKVGYSW